MVDPDCFCALIMAQLSNVSMAMWKYVKQEGQAI